MTETGTDETEDDPNGGKSKGSEVPSSSKSVDAAPKAYELPWLDKLTVA